MKKTTKFLVGTDYGTYDAIARPDEERGFVVTAPQVKGVVTWGKDIAHAKKMVREAIELVIESAVLDRKNSGRLTSRSVGKIAAA